jgi:putative ABC transport system substrate-binding protein
MKRRDVLAFAGAIAAASVTPSLAQLRDRKIPRIGIIDDGPIWNPYRQALRDAGLIEGQSINYVYRSSGGQPDRLTAAAQELVRDKVDLIAAYGTPPSRAAKAATSTIPIVMISVGDPVRAGLVQSLAHPGGNVTGNTILAPDLSPKRLQLVKEIIPSASRVALLWNPDNISNGVILEQMQAAAPALGLDFTAVEARDAAGIEKAFVTMQRDRPDAVLVTSDPLHQSHIQKIISFMFRYGLPGMFQTRDNAAAGGLMSYGASFADLFRQGAFFTQKILAGIKPADLPVQTPQRYELVINIKTAKAIGLTISDAVLLRADEVIE